MIFIFLLHFEQEYYLSKELLSSKMTPYQQTEETQKSEKSEGIYWNSTNSMEVYNQAVHNKFGKSCTEFHFIGGLALILDIVKLQHVSVLEIL